MRSINLPQNNLLHLPIVHQPIKIQISKVIKTVPRLQQALRHYRRVVFFVVGVEFGEEGGFF